MEIRVENLCKTYGEETVFDHLTFTAGPGITCIMAPSGTGKTTLLRILLGLEIPDSGTASVPKNCRWSAVFQEDRLLEQLDAEGNLHFALGAEYREEHARLLLEELGLEVGSGKPVRDFSGGMRRRLALARALLAPFDALVLDEPFSGLDRENRAKAIDCIRRETVDKPVLLVTHDESDVTALGATTIKLT